MLIRVCSGVGDLELVFVPPGAAVLGLNDKTVHDSVHPADFV